MNCKLSCADFAFPSLAHDEVLRLLRELEIEAVDIGLFPGRSHIQHDAVLEDTKKSAGNLVARVRDQGLEIADIFHQSGPDLYELAENHPDRAQRTRSRELFLRVLEFVVQCETSHMTTLPGVIWPDETAADSLARASEELAWRVEQAADSGITYAVEPHMESVVPTPDLAMTLARQTAGLTITLDYGHFIAAGFKEQAIGPLWQHASHFHARCAAFEKLQCSLEKNAIEWRRVVSTANKYGYHGYFGLEYVVMDEPGVDDVDTLAETVRLRDELRQAGIDNLPQPFEAGVTRSAIK